MNKVMIGFKCPKCQQAVFLPDIATIAEVDGSTMDCPHCQELILVRRGMAYRFHQYMHEQDPRWPADGTRTGYVTLE